MSSKRLASNNNQVPEGYKKTEIGVIPEDWDVRAIGDICDFIVPGRNKPKFFKGDIPWITTPDLEDGRSVSESKIGLFISRDEAKNVGSKIVPAGAVLMSCVGELGIVAFVEREIVINQQLHAFIPTPVVDPFFLLNALQAQKNFMLGIATLTAVPYLNKDNCNSIPIPLPPLPEQKAIAQTLSDVDALIAALDKLIAKKRHIKTATMQQLLTGKTRLPGFGEGKGYKKGEVGVIPEDWALIPLKLVCKVNQGLQIAIDKRLKNQNGKAKRYITIQSLNSDANLEYIDNYASSVVCNEEDILMTRTGNTGIVITGVSGVFHNNFFKVKFDKSKIDKNYFVFCLKSNSIQKEIMEKAGTSTIPDLNHNDFYSIRVILPPLLEQKAIAQVLSDIDTEITALEKRRAKTQAIKQGIMQELLTGRTRIIDN